MSHVIADRVLEASTSSGTGPFTLTGAVVGFRSFGAVCAVTDTVPYYIEAVDDAGRPTGDFEFGLGTYSAANQLTRTTVRGSSNGGLAVAFPAGTKLVGLAVPAPNTPDSRLEWRNSLGFTAVGNAVVTAADAAAARTALGVQGVETGDLMQKARITAPAGWVKLNGQTIGSAASGATGRANADCEALFTLLWNEFPQAVLAIQTSAGGASTRGASAAADWAANKRLPVFDGRGEFFRGLDEGRGADPGRGIGTWQDSQNKAHRHNMDYSQHFDTNGTYINRVARTSTTSQSAGSGTGDNVGMAAEGGTEARPRNLAFPWFIKL